MMNRLSIASVFLAILLLFISTARITAAEIASAPARAWIRFDDAAQNYKGTPYRFLGDGELQLDIAVRPQAGDALALLWGAKSDTREAVLIVNGRTAALQHGGYDGFEWWRVPLSADTAGGVYRVTFKAGCGKPAFLTEVRLANERVGGNVSMPQSARSSNVVLKVAAQTGEAFPHMRRSGILNQRSRNQFYPRAKRNCSARPVLSLPSLRR